MFKLIKKIHTEYSLKGRVVVTFAIIASIILCAFAVQSELSLLGCKSSMTMEEYGGAGIIGVCAGGLSFLIVRLVLFGAMSAPKAIKTFIADRKQYKAYEKSHGRSGFHQTKESIIKVAVGAVVVSVLFCAVVVGLGVVFGYVGWLIFC